jgi:hypothetical protein
MRESLIAALIAVLIMGFSLIKVAVNVTPELGVGVVVTLVGLAVGILGGLLYHVRLAQALRPRGLLDRYWIWHPTRLHVHLVEGSQDRRRVFAWFSVGAFGWVVAIAGCGLVALSVFGIL